MYIISAACRPTMALFYVNPGDLPQFSHWLLLLGLNVHLSREIQQEPPRPNHPQLINWFYFSCCKRATTFTRGPQRQFSPGSCGSTAENSLANEWLKSEQAPVFPEWLLPSAVPTLPWPTAPAIPEVCSTVKESAKSTAWVDEFKF